MTVPIYLDLTPLVTKSTERGIGRYVRGLVSGLAEIGFGEAAGLSVRGFVANGSVTRLATIRDAAEYARRPAVPPVPYANYRRTWLVSLGLPLLDVPKDAFIHLAEPMGIPWLERRRYGITCHDIISLALPELYLPKIPHWSVLYAGIERVRYGRATRILAVSECTRRDLGRFARISEDRIDVVHHGVDHARFHPRAEPGERERVAKALGTDAPYVLYLGAGDSRKDLDTLVAAFAETRAQKEMHLVIAGNIGEGRTASLAELATTLGISNVVHFPGYVDEAIVPSLYRQSVVHVFPSRYEGFGLPVLEALACGTPTITSPGSSLDEVAGDAASIVPCGDPPGLARALDDLVFDEARRGALRDRGIERAAPFTWRRCAEATLDYYLRATA